MDEQDHSRSGTSSDATSWNQASTSDLNLPRDPKMERSSASNLRSAFRHTLINATSTVRAVTPDPVEPPTVSVTAESQQSQRGASSQQSSPRTIPPGPTRRQGMVFNEVFSESYESSESSPPRQHLRHTSGSLRPRTRTMDTSMLAQRSVPPPTSERHRVGSVSSSGSLHPSDELRPQLSSLDSLHHAVITGRESLVPTKDKKSRRLMKRQSSRPTSPLISPPPTVDSLPLPIATDDANKVLLLMRTLCGRMRGEIEYQGETGGPWHSGVAYIEEEKGCLMFDSGQNGPFHIPLVSDLRGCRVLPVDYPELTKECLELVCLSPPVEILICPLVTEEFDLWLAALLCWQQLRPTGIKLANGKPANQVMPMRPELKRHGWSQEKNKPTNIIKVGKVMLWDKGLAVSPRAIVKRPSTRDLRSPTTSWRRVSCILQDSGEFKLMTENDVTVLSIIDLSQLSRCAVQQLDRTVLDEEYCIAIFPIYSSTSTHLSIFRPVYLALDSRVHFEVWLCLLRAFAVPDIYRLDDPNTSQIVELEDIESEYEGEVFRLEKTISVRVTEAKIKARPSGGGGTEPTIPERPGRPEPDPLIGNYLAEVILDGEVRARTTTKTATKNPFWREECEFTDLPPTTPLLSIVLKRVEGNLDSSSNLLQASVGLPRTRNLQEFVVGAVDISLDQLDRGKDSEQWLQIFDEKHQSVGQMLVKVNHDEHVVLLSKEYQPLTDLLHRFPAGLTNQVSAVLPGQLRRLAELFLNIFQVSGSASEWLMALVEDEIDGIGNQTTMKKYRFSSRLKSNDSIDAATDRELIVRDMSKSLAGEANLLFRGNSLLTQSLEFHMRRLGKEYLEEILQEKLFEINEINPDCEVDPSKIPHESDLDQHWTVLIHYTTEVWKCIANSANRLPPELRHILKYIRAVAEDRYGDFLRTVTYTSVSGFLFLRFICPAILSPKLFNLLRDHPRPHAQRTFTLIAKALQKLANLSNFGKREEWMEPMNRFLNVQRQSVRDYIDQVCSIPADRNANFVPAGYSTPVTILGRLSPTSKEGFPSLPYLIDDTRNLASLVKLWVDARPVDDKKEEVDQELLAFNDVCFALQQRADACLAKVETERASETVTCATTEDVAESIEQASLIESLSISYGGSSTAWNDVYEPTPGSSGSEVNDDNTIRNRRRSKERRRHHHHHKEGWEQRKQRHASTSGSASASASNTIKSKNGRVGRTILSGITRIVGRGESPEGKDSSKHFK
ncbi:related to BUD2-GTPase-activating protein for Bud1p/Rsr1p [Fusarium oxysporum]|uniref:Related to BUD2-GTPase-activating protein for Bud1p/Rsr1p n=1 Tax=Fusarium oxysporum TaxID=5507 RepID=A0A2H3T8G8_FUSOX|nr:related to BUD2-GTPase-activating protein for Bud1p/Rsr1p [Fusarium oxysporum]